MEKQKKTLNNRLSCIITIQSFNWFYYNKTMWVMFFTNSHCFFKLIRLVVKQYDIPVFVHTLHKRLHAFSSSVASVVAPYDTYTFIEINHAVSQKHNSGVREKLLRMPHTAIIFVIAGTGINRSIQLTKLRCHVFFNQWPYAAVYNIAGY